MYMFERSVVKMLTRNDFVWSSLCVWYGKIS